MQVTIECSFNSINYQKQQLIEKIKMITSQFKTIINCEDVTLDIICSSKDSNTTLDITAQNAIKLFGFDVRVID